LDGDPQKILHEVTDFMLQELCKDLKLKRAITVGLKKSKDDYLAIISDLRWDLDYSISDRKLYKQWKPILFLGD
jgi:hypothetical protein